MKKSDYRAIAKRLIGMQDADLDLRAQLIARQELFNGYHPEMQALHEANVVELTKVINKIGYPTIDKVGEKAHEAAWLVIQHAISQPSFMKQCLSFLRQAVKSKNANPLHLAYLEDRIAVFENRLQLYGTSFDWDEKGELNPHPYDDKALVNQRRKELGLNTLDEQVLLMRSQAALENQTPPKNYKQRKEEINKWKKSVGWIE